MSEFSINNFRGVGFNFDGTILDTHRLIDQDQAIPGSLELVRRLAVRRPGKLGLTTTNRELEITPFLVRNKLHKYFPHTNIVSAEDLIKSADFDPRPNAYKLLLGKLAIADPTEMIVFEHTQFGIEVAKRVGERVGCVVIAIATTQSYDELVNLDGIHKPDAIVEDYKQLTSLLHL